MNPAQIFIIIMFVLITSNALIFSYLWKQWVLSVEAHMDETSKSFYLYSEELIIARRVIADAGIYAEYSELRDQLLVKKDGLAKPASLD